MTSTRRSREALRGARGAARPVSSTCHVSHLYPTGASLYFTFLARAGRRGPERSSGRPRRAAACDAIIAAGGTITHHHAIGRDHAPWLPQEIGRTGVAALGAVKKQLDPAGIMNPGKLLP